MRAVTKCFLIGTMLLVSPLEAQSPRAPKVETAVDADHALFEQGIAAINEHRPAEAITAFERVIDHFDTFRATSKLQPFCARTPEESLAIMLTAVTGGYGSKSSTSGAHNIVVDTSIVGTKAVSKDGNNGAVIVSPDWCAAVFFKGFALIDLGRPAEAYPYFKRAVELAPNHAQYIAELAEFSKTKHDWPTALSLFQQAVDAAQTFSPPDAKQFELGRAMRGVAFVLSEQGKLDEAEAEYRKCLELDPSDAKATSELAWIAQERIRTQLVPKQKF